jgi:hypothetical protein
LESLGYGVKHGPEIAPEEFLSEWTATCAKMQQFSLPNRDRGTFSKTENVRCLALKREGASSLRTAKDFFSGLKKLEKCVAKRKGRQYLRSTEKAHIAGVKARSMVAARLFFTKHRTVKSVWMSAWSRIQSG